MRLPAKYFADIPLHQLDQFTRMEELYLEWNTRINVVSRKDIEHLALHHILHSLAIARAIRFKPATTVMDAGSGGGFPGIPLAVMFPDVTFTMVDSIGKKTRVIEAIAGALGLNNVRTLNTRFENLGESFDFVTGRAVSRLPVFYPMVRKCIRSKGFNELPNGVLYLTGGNVETEIKETGVKAAIWPLLSWFDDPYFETKKLVHLWE